MKKKAPKHLRKSKHAAQYCIDATQVHEVLALLNKSITINGCVIRFGMPISRRKVVVPQKLKKFGVQTLSEIKSVLEAEIVLDKTTPTAIKRAVKAVAEYTGVDQKKATYVAPMIFSSIMVIFPGRRHGFLQDREYFKLISMKMIRNMIGDKDD